MADPRSAWNYRNVVAVVAVCDQKMALLKRSSVVGHDAGLWHCVTGFLENGVPPRAQALQELTEEAGLRGHDLVSLRESGMLIVRDDRGDPWGVHVFLAKVRSQKLTLNWEHDAYQWVSRTQIDDVSGRVWWLTNVLQAIGADDFDDPRDHLSHPGMSGDVIPWKDLSHGTSQQVPARAS